MRKFFWLILVVIALVALAWYFSSQREVTVSTGEIIVEMPEAGAKVSSPLSLKGQARGSWYFEASAPVSIFDENGKMLGQSFVTAKGEWMTTEFVSFEGTIVFTEPQTKKGTVVFMNDNPSGDPSRSKSFSVPVSF